MLLSGGGCSAPLACARHYGVKECSNLADPGTSARDFFAHQRNPLVNLRLAKAIWQTIRQVASQWNTLSPEARSWLAGAILYFAKSDDEEPDLSSPIGFENDAEMLNTLPRSGFPEVCLTTLSAHEYICARDSEAKELALIQPYGAGNRARVAPPFLLSCKRSCARWLMSIRRGARSASPMYSSLMPTS